MQKLEKAVREVIGWLELNKIGYALIGGLAVSFQTIERFTKDVDLAVAVNDDKHAEKIVREITQLGYTVKTLLEQREQGRIATVRLIKGEEGYVFVDLLFASSGIEKEVVLGSERIDLFPGFPVNVASLASLLALKILAVDRVKRPQDVVDIKNLLSEADESHLNTTKDLLALIEQRGYNRNKDLLTELLSFCVTA